jgi:hypothetical protein
MGPPLVHHLRHATGAVGKAEKCRPGTHPYPPTHPLGEAVQVEHRRPGTRRVKSPHAFIMEDQPFTGQMLSTQ